MARLENLVALIAAYLNHNWNYLVAAVAIVGLLLCIKAVRDVAKAFFGIKDGEGATVGSKKVGWMAIKRIAYTIADYWLAGLCAAANIALKIWGVPIFWAFVVMWGINIVIAMVFFATYVKTGVDVSLGEDLRRAVDAVHSKSKLAGYISMLGVIFQAIFWSGPEQIVIFFQKEIGGRWRSVVAIFVLTAIQTAIWMFLYRAGYDLVVKG